jgi:peptide methionine sulfoxide reductase MsrB
MSPPKVQKSDQEWQAVLSPEQFRVLRKQGTEAPGSSPLDKHSPKSGQYTCAGCDAPLYTAQVCQVSSDDITNHFSTSFQADVVGLHSLMLSMAPLRSTRTTVCL